MTDTTEQKFALSASPGFSEWLARTNASLAFTTYQAGKLFLLGTRADGRLSVFERTFPRCMGLAVGADGRSLLLATQYQIQRIDNVLPAGETREGFDALYAPHAAWVTGDLDVHDIGFGAADRPVFVNTLFSCLAMASDGHSFRALWKPPFLSRLAAEDRCHLNGLAMDGANPRYATATARSDIPQGWRDQRERGGVVIDVATGEIVCEGLSMPHSPRLHGGRLWLLNSGKGEFGHVDLRTGRFEPVAFCAGYARGLAFLDGKAIIGLSLARDNQAFAGLPLDHALAARGAEARCGLEVVDLESGRSTGRAQIEGLVRELYDVAVLPGIRRPSLVGFRTDDVKQIISIEG